MKKNVGTIHELSLQVGCVSDRVTHHFRLSQNWRLLNLRSLEILFRELHKKDELLAAALRYPILWDGHLARPCIISGQDARTTRNFRYFFN